MHIPTKHHPFTTNQRHLVIGIIAALILGFGLIFSAIWLVNKNKTATLELLVAPASATITLHDTATASDQALQNGTHRLLPGTYTLTVAHPDFPEPYSTTLELPEHQTIHFYHILDGNENYYRAHEDDARLAERVAGRQAEQAQQARIASDPIYKITPYHDYNQGFDLTVVENDVKNTTSNTNDTPITLHAYLYTCKASEEPILKQHLHDWLTEQGINPENYHIEYSSCN